MKKLLFAGFAALLFLGCSEEKTNEEPYNPYRPISGLEIPREAISGENMVLKGKGFAADCLLELQLNGQTEKTVADRVAVDEKSLTVNLPEALGMGFYAVLLTQDGATTTIGGVNIKVNKYTDDDFQIYGLVGTDLEICPVSVSKQMLAPEPLPNSSATVYGYNGYATATSSGKVYYAGFDMTQSGKYLFQVGCYDINTQVNTAPKSIDNFFLMGEVDGKFCILKTADRKTYSLVEWNDGVETPIRDFDLSQFGGAPILSPDNRFVYHAPTGTILFGGNMGSGENMSQATFSLDVESGAVAKNGGDNSCRYWFASTGKDAYCFTVVTDENDTSTTQVFRLDNPQQWTVKGSGATLVTTVSGSAFESPAYSGVSGMIYGFDSYDTFGALLTFNPEGGNIEGRRWVNPGLACIFYAPRKVTDN